MARGITEYDVFTACDALLLAGERPTIERVRQKIGRGSPNTVSPMLDVWFKGLGRRLQDPGAFAPAPDVPEPVLQAAQHFWDVAQAQARGNFDQGVADALAPLQRELDAALEEAAALQAADEARTREMEVLRGQLADTARRLDAERLTHAATTALLDDARAQHENLRGRVVAAETQAREADERAHRDSDAAHERATGAERRAALEIESERAARGRAEKRSEALERRIESLQVANQGAAASQLAELVSARSALDAAREQLAQQCTLAENASRCADIAEAALVDAKLARERAEGHALGLQETIGRFERMLPKMEMKRAAKPARAAKL
jgi:chromosome segregation ATPase